MTSLSEYQSAVARLKKHKEDLAKRVEFTTSLPKFDDRGVIVGVKKKDHSDESK